MLSPTGEHRGDHRQRLRATVRTVARQRHALLDQGPPARPAGPAPPPATTPPTAPDSPHRSSPTHDSNHEMLAPNGCPSRPVRLGPSASPIVRPRRTFVRYDALNRSCWSVDPGLVSRAIASQSQTRSSPRSRGRSVLPAGHRVGVVLAGIERNHRAVVFRVRR